MFEEYFLLTRKPQIYESDPTMFTQTFEQHGLDTSKIRRIKHDKKCKYEF